MAQIPDEHIAKVFNVEVKNYTRGVPVGSPNSVRCYINSPETILLQLRGKTRYASCNLTPAQAKELAANLLAQAEAFPSG